MIELKYLAAPLSRQFCGRNDLGEPTPKQIERKFGYDISTVSRRVGEAIIDDIMMQLNREAIEDQRLAPGVEGANFGRRILKFYALMYIIKSGLAAERKGGWSCQRD
jgi:hypothetical protein